MLAQQVLTGLVHRVEIQAREAALPGVGGHERVFLPCVALKRAWKSSGAGRTAWTTTERGRMAFNL